MKHPLSPLLLVFVLILSCGGGGSQDAPRAYSLAVTAEHALVTILPEKSGYQDGERVRIDIYPHAGYRFSAWEGSASGSSLVLDLTVNGDMVLNGKCVADPAKQQWIAANKPGLMDGSLLTEYAGGNATIADGQVFENLLITKRIYVNHADVVFRNCRLAGNADDFYVLYTTLPGSSTPQGGVNMTIEHCEITRNLMLKNPFTARHNHIHAAPGQYMNDGLFFTAGDVLIEGNLIDGLNGTSGAHLDGVQLEKGSNITLRGNWIEAISHDPIGGGGMVTSAVFACPTIGPMSNLTLDGNMFVEEADAGLGYGYYPLRLDRITGTVLVRNNRWDIDRHGLSLPYRIQDMVVTTWSNNAYTNGDVIAGP